MKLGRSAALAAALGCWPISACMLNPLNGTVAGAVTSDAQSFNGYTDTPSQTLSLQILDPAWADPAVDANWQLVANPVSGTTPSFFFDSDKPDHPLYSWGTSFAPTAGGVNRWRPGGLYRIRGTTGGDPTAANQGAITIFDDDFFTCLGQHDFHTSSWAAVGEDCRTLYEVLRPDGTGSLEAVIASSTPTPADTVLPPANDNQFGRYLFSFGYPSQSETQTYYNNIGAGIISTPRGNIGAPISTYAGFLGQYGFFGGGGDQVSAIYYNQADLGLARAMSCRSFSTSAGPGRACYVTNYGSGATTFGGDPQVALTQAISDSDAGHSIAHSVATVAMAYDPSDTNNPVKFVVYGKDGNAQPFALLDDHGAGDGSNVSVPSNCLSCHGADAKYDRANQRITGGAHFLPFDPFRFIYSTTDGRYSQSAQAEPIRQLNQHVYNANPTGAIKDLLQGMYGNANGPVAGTTATDTYIPTGWKASKISQKVYAEVVRPYCRTCHVSREDGDSLSFLSFDTFKSFSSAIGRAVCAQHTMPNAVQTQRNFWASPARAHVVGALNLVTDCVPQ